jgi:hypothetical protein
MSKAEENYSRLRVELCFRKRLSEDGVEKDRNRRGKFMKSSRDLTGIANHG